MTANQLERPPERTQVIEGELAFDPKALLPVQAASTPTLFYTGIGSRKTPDSVLATFTSLATMLERAGWILRSGGADGADAAFAAGALNPSGCEIFLPWSGFNGCTRGMRPQQGVWSQASKIAAGVHPAWGRLNTPIRALHTRNVFQVLGSDLQTPSLFVVCWTPDGAETENESSRDTGGTRTAIVLAARHGIPVVNFARSGAQERLHQVLHGLGHESQESQESQDWPEERES